MPIIDAMLMEFEQEANTTRRVLERVPEDKLTWQPHPKSMTLGKLATHVATIPAFIAEAAMQDAFEITGRPASEAKSRQELLDTFAESVAQAKDKLRQLDDATLMSNWALTREGKVIFNIPRIALVRTILLNHSYHHRGQLSVYLRLLDAPVPSIYGPSADENPFG